MSNERLECAEEVEEAKERWQLMGRERREVVGGRGREDERASDRPAASGGANPSSTTFSSQCQCAPQDQHQHTVPPRSAVASAVGSLCGL